MILMLRSDVYLSFLRIKTKSIKIKSENLPKSILFSHEMNSTIFYKTYKLV